MSKVAPMRLCVSTGDTLMDDRSRLRLRYCLFVILAGIWLCAIGAAPWALLQGYEWPAVLLYRGFSFICHQRPERSFHWHQLPLAVCVRCTGIYLGALLGLVAYPFWRGLVNTHLPPRRYWLLALGALGVNWLLGALGLLGNDVCARLVTGLMLGTTTMFYLLPLLLRQTVRPMNP